MAAVTRCVASVAAAFGKSYDEFLEILSMPDDYIIYRKNNETRAENWKREYDKLTMSEKSEFLSLLEAVHKTPRDRTFTFDTKYSHLLKYYYPDKNL